ncbi:telomerase RNA component interacting RNase isoform X2 [Notamacropus eugenii]|uniref:telomerase RNA component interacting RNase isoform X2 n=1 Tax=Notamacropus eugenii TaxID=9315 RepID=UPI003B67C79D
MSLRGLLPSKGRRRGEERGRSDGEKGCCFPESFARKPRGGRALRGAGSLPSVLCAAPGHKMAARGRRAEPAGREPSGPAGGGAGGGGGSRWPGPGGAGAESGAGSGAGEEEEDAAAASGPASGGVNLFANDGSFLELFKRKMEEEEERRRQRQQQSPDEPPAPPGAAAPVAPAGGEPKRRSGPGPAALSFVGQAGHGLVLHDRHEELR